MVGVEVLSSRILLRPADLDRNRQFYRDVLGLAVYREFGTSADPGVVFFLGSGFLEVSGRSADTVGHSVMIWLQVRPVWHIEAPHWLRGFLLPRALTSHLSPRARGTAFWHAQNK
jgi:catechol 2,3-dioxygenase-like lactoylglutathione lyase family enzyme